MSYTPQYTKPYANGYVDRPSKETPERASFINARDDTLIRIEKYLSTLNFDGKYALLTEAGYSLELSIDEYYVLTISLKNKAGTVISSKQIDFPIESMIINVDYNEDTGIITFNLQNGQSLEVNISTLVRGLVADTRTIAGIDLKDDITAEELKEALGYLTETDIAELNTSSAVAYYESKINTAITAPARTYTDMATITLPIGTYVVQSSFRSSEDGFRFYQGLQVEDEFLRDTRYDSMGIVASTWSTIVHLTKEMELIYKLWVDKEVVIDETQIRAVRINDNGGTEMAGTIKPWLYDISGEEVVVGVYNGKPIYRKYFTIHVTTTNGLYTQAITDLIPDYEEILNHKMYTTSGNLLNAIYANQGTLDTQDWMSYFVNVGGNIISISRSTSQPELDNDFSFMAEYTKTTDAEGSGNNLNPYGIYDAKLDDVKSSIASVSDAVEEQLKKPTNLFDGNFKFYTSDRSSESANMASIQSDLSTAATYFAGRYCFVHIVFANGITYDYIGSVVNSNYAVFEEMSYSSTEKRRFILKAGEWTMETLIDSKDLIDTDGTIISYTADNKAEALAYLNNPTTIPFIGARTRCYNFLFADSVGDSPFGGGYVRISGYTYSNNLYGMQMAYRFGQRPKWRSNNNGVWSEWDGVGTLAEVTALQKATESDIEAINSRLEVNKSATRQSIIDTTSTNKYTCPCDGYVYINVKANSRLYCYIYDSAGVVIGMIGIGGGSEYAYNDTLFVKKGMLLCMEDNTDTTMGSCNFIGLDG